MWAARGDPKGRTSTNAVPKETGETAFTQTIALCCEFQGFAVLSFLQHRENHCHHSASENHMGCNQNLYCVFCVLSLSLSVCYPLNLGGFVIEVDT